MRCKICNKIIKQSQDRNRTKCSGCYTKLRRYRTKAAAVKSKGGKCNRCGWRGNIVAFQFHHIDPGNKDFDIGMCANKSWKLIKAEIRKCELLCANCHNIEHTNNEDEIFLEEVKNYNGNLLI